MGEEEMDILESSLLRSPQQTVMTDALNRDNAIMG